MTRQNQDTRILVQSDRDLMADYFAHRVAVSVVGERLADLETRLAKLGLTDPVSVEVAA